MIYHIVQIFDLFHRKDMFGKNISLYRNLKYVLLLMVDCWRYGTTASKRRIASRIGCQWIIFSSQESKSLMCNRLSMAMMPSCCLLMGRCHAIWPRNGWRRLMGLDSRFTICWKVPLRSTWVSRP